jgi:predicted anti-sigma-YlaC factor YlaD
MSARQPLLWGRILLAAFLAEASVMAGFFLLLGLAWMVGVPEVAAPMTPLDYADALIASFVSIFIATRWVGRRLEGAFVLHGILIALVAMSVGFDPAAGAVLACARAEVRRRHRRRDRGRTPP